MIYETAYQTTIGSMMDVRPITKSIRVMLVKDLPALQTFGCQVKGNIRPFFLTGLGDEEGTVPQFAHPLLYKDDGGHQYLLTDVRAFVRQLSKFDDSVSEKDIKNTTEWRLALHRAVLTQAWILKEQSVLRTGLELAGLVYAVWLSEVITKKFALDPKDQVLVSIAAHYFYQSLFQEEIRESELMMMAAKTAKVLKVDVKSCFSVFDKMTDVRTIDDFCKVLSKVTENIRLEGFNIGVVLSLISNSWYGHESKQILSVALEHPPTWCAIIYASIKERTYKNFLVARIADRYGKNGGTSDYCKSFDEIVLRYTTSRAQEELVFRDFE